MKYLEDDLFTLPKRTKIALMIFKLGLILCIAISANLLNKQNIKLQKKIIEKIQEEKNIEEQIKQKYLIKQLRIKETI